MGLCAFATVLTGCVARQPVIYTKKVEKPNAKGQTEEIITKTAGNKEQFTPLGVVWNTGAYGVLGTAWGIPKGWYDGYYDTNTTSVLKKTFNGTTGALMGPFTGLYRGMNYGYHLDYQKDRSVEGRIFDLIEHTANSTGNFIQNLGR